MYALILTLVLAAPVDFVERSGFEILTSEQKTQLGTGVAAAWPESRPANIQRLECEKKDDGLWCFVSDRRAGTVDEQVAAEQIGNGSGFSIGEYTYATTRRLLTAGEVTWLASWAALVWPAVDMATVTHLEVERARGEIFAHIHYERTASPAVYHAQRLAGLVIKRLD